ncbi:MAG: discoidin domain-containing protein [Thermoguttaceae bacterium]
MTCSPTIRWTFLSTLAVALCQAALAAAADDAKPANGKLVPLKFEIPKALFVGTPKNIKASATLEPYSEKPLAPLMVPAGCTDNLALKKKVTSSDSAPIIGELSLVTDGDKDGSDGSFVELAPGKQWVQIDLENPADIAAIVVWHYYAEGRVYHSVVVQISDDPEFTKDVKTVFNNDFTNALGFGAGKQLEYIDDHRGKVIAVKDEKGRPVRGRYVRLHSNGNTSSDQNHYIEVEVYGKPVK